MTVASTTTRADYVGSGITGPYPFPFRIQYAADLTVIARNIATGLETTLTYLGDYTFSTGAIGSRNGGSITLTNALATGNTLSLVRSPALTQLTNLRNQGRYFPSDVEDALDRGVMMAQELDDAIDRSVRLPVSVSPATFDPTLPAVLTAGSAIVVNASGTGLSQQAMSAAQLSAWNAANNIKLDVYTSALAQFTPGVTTQLTLTAAPGSLSNLRITRRTSGTVVVYESDEYSISGTTLTFTAAIPANTTRVEVSYLYTYQVNTVDSANATWNASGTGAAARSVRDKLRDTVSITDFTGVVGDGTTDCSVPIQQCIDANKGKRILIPGDASGGQYLCAGILLSGSSYNGTEIICCGGELKLKADGGASNFDTSIWMGLAVVSADRVVLDLKWNGNRAAMTNRESVHCTLLCGATNPHVTSFVCREIRGDGLYIGRVSPITGGAQSTDVTVDSIRGVNTADDGRNLCSVITCGGLTIGELYSDKIGGVVGGLQMPGGLDLEPNHIDRNHSVTDVVIGTVNVITAGSAGFQLNGWALTNDATRDWNIQRVSVGTVKVVNTSASGYPLMFRCRDVTISSLSSQHTGSRGFGVHIDYADRIKIPSLNTNFVTSGALLGYYDFVYDSELTITTRDYSASGIESIGVTRCVIRGKVYLASSAVATYAIHTRSNIALPRAAVTQTSVIYEVDAPFDSLNVRAFLNEPGDPVTFGTGTVARNCDWSGYGSTALMVTGAIPRYNIQGFQERETSARFIGNGTAHVAGDYVLAGWGTASLTLVDAKDTGGRVTITITGGVPAANPTINLTFKDGVWGSIPAVVCSPGVGSGAIANWAVIDRQVGSVQFVWIGTPASPLTYVLDFIVMGK